MNSKFINDKYKIKKNKNLKIKKYKNKIIEISPKIEHMETNIPIKTNRKEYFPIESEKSKEGGRTIYLVTEDTNFNNDNIVIPKNII